MKKSTKIISLILAVVMVFSASCISAAASAIPAAAQDSIENLIQNKNLAELVGWLITNLNDAKGNITGTVLRLVYEFVGDKIGGEGKDTFSMTDEQLATTLLDWLDANLPEWTKSISEQEWLDPVQNLLGITLDLKSVDGILETVRSVCNKVNKDDLVGAALGDLKGLKGSALEGVKRAPGGDIKVIHALLQWVNDNQKFIKSFIIGGIGSNGIKLGSATTSLINRFYSLENINKIVRGIPDFAKGWIYLLVDGYAEKPDIQDNPKGGWGASPYASYTADELLASALINVINDDYKHSSDDELKVVPQTETKEVLGLTFYGMLTKYGPDLYARFAVDFLNGTLKDLIGKLKDYPEAAKAFNMNYEFKNDSFKAVFAGASSTGFLGQFNNILGVIFKTVLSDSAYRAIAFKDGGNSELNGNLTRVCRYVLPVLAKYSKELKFDFTKFTEASVKDMELPEMAVGVLKIFFPTWFEDGYGKEKDLLKNAETLAQMGVVAMKYVLAFPGLQGFFKNGFSAEDLTKDITAAKIAELDDETCIELAAGIGARLGAYALDQRKDVTHFTLNKDAAKWTWQELCDEIVDWAINFVKGIPAVAVDHIEAEMGKLDGNGPFYKINVILNELIDFSFLSDVNDETFKLDSETLLFDTILKNGLNFDLASIIKVFEVNTNTGNVLNGKVIPGVISIVDRLLTALFSHTCGSAAEFQKEFDCTHAIAGTYDTNNGHYNADVKEVANYDSHEYVEIPELNKEPTCSEKGVRHYECSKCGEVKEDAISATGKHDFQYVSTDEKNGVIIYKCSVCQKEKTEIIESPIPENLCDVTGDGKYGADDARLALRASVKLEVYAEDSAEFKAADVDGNGTIGADDARTILRLSVKLENLDDIKAKYAA